MSTTANNREIHIGERAVGLDHPPFIVAELSANHNQSLDRALEIIDAVADAGADAIKLQTYTPDSMTLDHDGPGFVIDDPKSLWHGESLYSLYGKAMTPWEWHPPLFARAREKGLIPFSSPFDARAVGLLEELDSPCYKIASFELVDLSLIRCAARTGKPLIMSTGMALVEEIEEGVTAAREGGARDIILLRCTSAYPASPTESDLLTLPDMEERFDCLVGLSDHTPGVGVPAASIALGACMVEKHVTLSRADGGVDSAFSLEPDELAALVTESRRAWEARGRVRYGPTETEKRSLVFRRSLYLVRDVEVGEVLTADHVRAIRPAHGLPPKELHHVIGRRVRVAAGVGTPLSWELFE